MEYILDSFMLFIICVANFSLSIMTNQDNRRVVSTVAPCSQSVFGVLQWCDLSELSLQVSIETFAWEKMSYLMLGPANILAFMDEEELSKDDQLNNEIQLLLSTKLTKTINLY